MIAEDTKEKETLPFSNVTIVRDIEGKFDLYVGKEKALGVTRIQSVPLDNGGNIWSFAISGDRVRISELVPVMPAEKVGNVIQFPKFRAALALSNTEPPASA